jgi:ribonuclease P protein component
MEPTVRKRFPRSSRLLRHADFERVYKQGQRHFAAHMTVFYLSRSNEDAQGSRVGFTVGKVLGGAVVRNRMRRRLREAVRLMDRNQGLAVDVVINPKKSLLTAEFAAIQQDMKKAFAVIERKCSEPAAQ